MQVIQQAKRGSGIECRGLAPTCSSKEYDQ